MRHVWLACCLLVGFADFTSIVSAQPETFEGNPDSSAFIWIPRDTDDWTRHFRIGAMVGINISANFRMNGPFNVNRRSGIYDDGYVLKDSGSTRTSDWGDDNNGQYDSSSQTIKMHAVTSYSTANSGKETGAFPGFDMAYGGNLWYWKHARVGWELGFGLLPISISHKFSGVADVNQTTYTFDASNPYGQPPPNAPYNGEPDQLGYGAFRISNTYLAATNQTFADEPITGKETLDVMFYALRLGPTFYWDLGEHVSLSLGAGPAVGLVSGDYKYDETITISGSPSVHNSGKIEGTDFIYGGYVNATVLCHVTDNGDIYAGVQFMPMSDATIGGGGREGRLNLGGQVYFTVGVNWPF